MYDAFCRNAFFRCQWFRCFSSLLLLWKEQYDNLKLVFQWTTASSPIACSFTTGCLLVLFVPSMAAVFNLLRFTDHLVNFVSVRGPPRSSRAKAGPRAEQNSICLAKFPIRTTLFSQLHEKFRSWVSEIKEIDKFQTFLFSHIFFLKSDICRPCLQTTSQMAADQWWSADHRLKTTALWLPSFSTALFRLFSYYITVLQLLCSGGFTHVTTYIQSSRQLELNVVYQVAVKASIMISRMRMLRLTVIFGWVVWDCFSECWELFFKDSHV